MVKIDPIDGSREVIGTNRTVGTIEGIIAEIILENAKRAEWLASQGFTEEEIQRSLIEWNVVNYSFWEYKVLTSNGYCLAKGETPFAHNPYLCRFPRFAIQSLMLQFWFYSLSLIQKGLTNSSLFDRIISL